MPSKQSAEFLAVSNLRVDRSNKVILENISFSLERSGPFSIIGPSGSGKTTLVLAILGLLPSSAGSVRIKGKDIAALGPRERAKLVGMVFQDYQLFPQFTVQENITLPAKLNGIDNFRDSSVRLCQELGIDELRDSYPYQLSGGQKQRVAIARSLILGPQVLFFDEPSAALDLQTTYELANLLQTVNKKSQIIVISHDWPFMEACCDRGLRIDKGKIIAQGTIDQLKDS